MANDTNLTICGNLADDPTLRFTPSGAAVANFRVLSTPRTFDKTRNEWVDGETLALNCSIWRDAAENVAESLVRGARVIVTGRIKSRSYEKDGQQRTVIEMEVDEVGPSLRYATARVTKAQRGQGTTQQPRGATNNARGQSDPWATQSGGGSWGAPALDEPPFFAPASNYGEL